MREDDFFFCFAMRVCVIIIYNIFTEYENFVKII